MGKYVIANVSDKKLNECYRILSKQSIHADIIGGWKSQPGRTPNIKDTNFVLYSNFNDFLKKNDLSGFNLIFIGHLYSITQEIETMIENIVKRKITLIIGSSLALKWYSLKINSLCKKYSIPVFYYWLEDEQIYDILEPNEIPWGNYENLDKDFEYVLKEKNIQDGCVLDIGTGLGYQALRLSEMGFDVVATDLSPLAIERAKEIHGNKVKYKVDNVLNSGLGQKFDYIFDRGCFHGMNKGDRESYCINIDKLLKKEGYLFIKALAIDDDLESHPYMLNRNDFESTFQNPFQIERITEGIMFGAFNLQAKSLFATIKKN